MTFSYKLFLPSLKFFDLVQQKGFIWNHKYVGKSNKNLSSMTKKEWSWRGEKKYRQEHEQHSTTYVKQTNSCFSRNIPFSHYAPFIIHTHTHTHLYFMPVCFPVDSFSEMWRGVKEPKLRAMMATVRNLARAWFTTLGLVALCLLWSPFPLLRLWSVQAMDTCMAVL